MVNPQRVRSRRGGEPAKGTVLYWMSRDQRVRDNWALLYAQELAVGAGQPLAVVFCLAAEFLGATMRHYGFMLRGLREVAARLATFNIPFFVLRGEPANELPRFLSTLRCGSLVTDFDPLRIKRQWRDDVARQIDIPFAEVDAHNIVPCWAASDRLEYGAYTLRPKIHRALPVFLEDYPALKKQGLPFKGVPLAVEWDQIIAGLRVDESVAEVSWCRSGENAAGRVLRNFIGRRLEGYVKERNDPSKAGQSDLSPYLHFGQLSAQRVALEVSRANAKKESLDSFLEELIVRRELSDNFCYFNQAYDVVGGFPAWARASHEKHQWDKRQHVYSLRELEEGKTHDDLWNAAQAEMVQRGKMHGYMRMYWAKKILEWTPSAEEAMSCAIYLNDRYELDGRDPNGYTGIAWSIGGVHDRAWFERPLFGKVRYMSYNGCRTKFNVQAYIDHAATL